MSLENGSAAGKTTVCGARNGKFLGRVVLADELRPEAPEAISTLEASGYESANPQLGLLVRHVL